MKNNLFKKIYSLFSKNSVYYVKEVNYVLNSIPTPSPATVGNRSTRGTNSGVFDLRIHKIK